MTAVQPLIWYKDGGTNVGTLASSGNFVQANSQTTITSLTGVTGATINCLRVVPTTLPQLSATTTLPFSQTIPSYAGTGVYAISFWFKLIATTKNAGTALFSYTMNGVTKYVFLSTTGLSVNGTLVNMGSPALWDSQWHFFCVYARGGGGSDTYIIDQLYGYPSSTTNEAGKTMTGFMPGYSSTSGVALNGYMADLRIYGGYYPNGGSASDHAFEYMYKIGKNVNLSTLSTAPAYLLIHANASYAQLLAAGYTATTLLGSPSNIAASALYAIGATIAQLRAVQTVLQLIAGGITIDNLLAAPYTYTQLIVNESVTKTQFDSGGKTIQNLIAGGVTISTLVTAGYTIPQLLAVPYTYGQLVTGGIAISTLLGSPNNYTIPQLYTGGVTIAQFIAASYTISQLYAGGITIANFISASYTLSQLYAGGITIAQFIAASYTISQLYAGGITIPQFIAASYTISQLYTGGVTIAQFIAASYTISQLYAGGITIANFIADSYTISQLYAGGITIPQFTAASYTISQLYAGGITIPQFVADSYTFLQLIDGGITIAEFIAASYTFLQLIAGGITIDNLLAASYTYTQLIDNSVTKTQFDSGGKTIQNLISGGVTISKLVTAQYSFSQMIAGGVTSAQFSTQGYSIANLVNGGATNRELLLAGYSLGDLQSAGILPAWNNDVSSNCLTTSYVQEFVDVSGSIVLRENSNLYISGNTETAGNVSLNRLFVTADASFNRRIFVGGDVSMNGNVAMIGDLSMNGTLTKCSFNNSSIPKSAFSGTVPDGPNYNTSRIVYDQTFQANDDVSMNGPTLAANNVKVSGNIVFNDGTVMNTYDNNILSTNPTVFNSSTFTALDICGNLVAGSYATSSDYRIKTNVVELDETYTVDKLRPVKYYQTQINREKYGLIAHELQEHYPDLVIGEKDGSELQRVNYTGLIAILINDIKRMKRELTELENDVMVGR